jgi:hypothetical protein
MVDAYHTAKKTKTEKPAEQEETEKQPEVRVF